MGRSGAAQVAPALRQRCIASPALQPCCCQKEGSVRSTHPQVRHVCGQACQLAVINEKRLGALHRGSHARQLLIQQAELCTHGGSRAAQRGREGALGGLAGRLAVSFRDTQVNVAGLA